MCLNAQVSWTCPFEYVKALKRCIERDGKDIAHIAQGINKPECWVQELLDLDQLPDYCKIALTRLLDLIHAPKLDFALEYQRLYKNHRTPVLVSQYSQNRKECAAITRL